MKAYVVMRRRDPVAVRMTLEEANEVIANLLKLELDEHGHGVGWDYSRSALHIVPVSA